MQRRNTRSRGADPPARFIDSSVELGSNDPPEPRDKKYTKRAVRKRGQNAVVEMIMKKSAAIANGFFDARTGPKGCFVAGVVRCCYASLYLYSILLMTFQMPTLFDPRKGLMPYFITGVNDEDEVDYDYSIFEFAPKSSLLMYAVFLLGVTSGFLLLLGIEPRKGAIGAYFFLYNMQYHNDNLFDHEFFMSKMWAFFLILLPLDHFTIYDNFGGYFTVLQSRFNLPLPQSSQRKQSTSWPMWPFRLWQVYTCMVYMGAGFGKLNSTEWTSGNALSWIWYDEGVGRLYPAFVVDLLFNRLISIKLQTWISLLVENICFITIWPLKTRKITFVAIVLFHIGTELALVMHIFEYLSVLGWVCFFVYPNDGESKTDVLIKNKKNDGVKWTPQNAFGSRKVKTIEMAVALSLLYLLIYDIFPREEAEEWMPAPLAYLAYYFVYPPAFVNTKLDILTHLIGISSGPYELFKGKPVHTQTRMTAVIRFSDGKEPILHEDQDWATSSFLRRELNYWYDAYTWNLYEDINDPDEIPYYAALSVHLAELYGNGRIDRQYDKVTVDPNNNIESVSIKVHRRIGSELPAPPGWGLFSSIPREWTYLSLCQFVFTPQDVQLEDQKYILPIETMWDSPDYTPYHIKNGCARYNPEDDVLHSTGQYGEMVIVDEDETNDDDGDGDDESEQIGAGLNEDDGEDTPPIAQDDDQAEAENKNNGEENEDDGEENPNYGEVNEDDTVINRNGGANEEDNDEEEDPPIVSIRKIDDNDDDGGDGNGEDPVSRTSPVENDGEEPVDEVAESVMDLVKDSIHQIQEEDGENEGEDGGDTDGESSDADGEEGSGDSAEDGPDTNEEEGEDGESGDNDQNRRQLRSRS